MIVVWRVTQHCDLACPFCGYDRRVSRLRRDADPEQVRRFGAVLAQYQQRTGDPVLVSWMGGEPLLWWPLPDLATEFVRAHGLRISVTTNGTRLGEPATRAHVLALYHELTVSVDAIGAKHEHWRGWEGGWPALRTAVQQLAAERRAAARGPRLRANVVLMRDTVDEFAALCLELADWGIEEITFNQLGGVDRPEFHAAHRLLPEHAGRLALELPPLQKRLGAQGVTLRGGPEYLRRIHASVHGMRLPVDDCSPGQRFLFIREDGLIAPCNFTVMQLGVPMAEIDSGTALQELAARFTAEIRRRTPRPCEDCHSTQVFEKFAA